MCNEIAGAIIFGVLIAVLVLAVWATRGHERTKG